jgi:hypothetical protein
VRAAVLFVAIAGCSFSPSDASAIDATSGARSDAPATLRDDAGTPDAFAGISLVQIASGVANPWGDGASTIAASFPAPIAQGDLVAVFVTYAGNTTVQTIADDAGNSYTKLEDIDDGGDTQKSATGYGVAVAAGATAITVTFADSKCCRLLIAHELHGVAASQPLDAHSSHEDDNAKASPDAVTSDSMTTSSDRDYIFAATSNASNEDGEVISAGTGMQLRANPPVGDGNPTASEDLIQVTHGAFASTFTYSSSGAALTMQMAFRP